MRTFQRWFSLALTFSLVAPLAATPPPESWQADTQAWRDGREERLRDPEGWLSLVALERLREGGNRLGSDPELELVLPAPAPARLGTLELKEDGSLEADLVEGVTIEGELVPTHPFAISDDGEGADPTVLEWSTLRFFVIQRGERHYLRVKDRDSPRLAAFHGMPWYAIDPSWRIEGRFETAPAQVVVPDILGTNESEESPGYLVFERGGREHKLRLLASGEDRFFLIFGDDTNGVDTYGAGRFLYLDRPGDGEPLVADFNRAYSPPCIFTEFATCPLPPEGNRLPLAVEAGEKAIPH